MAWAICARSPGRGACRQGSSVGSCGPAQPSSAGSNRVVLPGQRPSRDCMRELHDGGMCQRRHARRRAQTAHGRVRGHADAAGPQPRAKIPGTPGAGIPGKVVPFQAGWPLSSPTATATRCRKWGGTRSGRKPDGRQGAPGLGRHCPTVAGSTLCTATNPTVRCAHTAARTEYIGTFTAPWRDNIFAAVPPGKSADRPCSLSLPSLEIPETPSAFLLTPCCSTAIVQRTVTVLRLKQG